VWSDRADLPRLDADQGEPIYDATLAVHYEAHVVSIEEGARLHAVRRRKRAPGAKNGNPHRVVSLHQRVTGCGNRAILPLDAVFLGSFPNGVAPRRDAA
jgi:hypothetical protein